MMTTQSAQPVELYLDKFDYLIQQLESASEIGKLTYQNRVLEASARLLMHENGLNALSGRIQRMDRAGIFIGTDWNTPASLMPGLVSNALECDVTATVTLECLSLLRFLAAATQAHRTRGLPAQKARHFLTQVLALNLDRVLGAASEASRLKENKLSRAVDRLLRHIMETVGAQGILDRLVEEVWRILSQRPLQVNPVKSMIVQISVALNEDRSGLSDTRIQGADRLISALFGPTQLCRDDPGIQLYRQRLSGADRGTLQAEALGMARAMHDTGLVSDYQVEFTHFVLDSDDSDLLTHSMGLSSTGLDAFRSYQPLILSLIRASVHLGTGQALLGISQILERGILYSPPIAPSLWRLLATKPSEMSISLLQRAFGPDIDARRTLVAGLLQMLGQPLGVGQGNNPTCQSARALSMWALNDPDYLLWLIAQVSNNDRIVMHFEGCKLDSGELPAGLAFNVPLDADAVSILLVPHLDRIYAEMGRRVAGRGEDPHKWINPELHGWWVGRMFFIAVDVATGLLHDYSRFVADFYQAYHPLYNGNEPIIHPQPAGVAVTDSSGAFVGWHTITLIRVALDQSGCMRVYFFNPNNDSGQDWGNGVVVSTQGHGELPGESSLSFEDFTSRLYIFHDDGLKGSQEPYIDPAIIDKVQQQAVASWAAQRIALTAGT